MPEPRNYIFANGTAYSIFLTVAHLVTNYHGRAADECVRSLIEYQYSNIRPDFLPFLDDDEHDDPTVLVYLDLWLREFGVGYPWTTADRLLQDAGDDSSLGSWTESDDDADPTSVVMEPAYTMGREMMLNPVFLNYYYERQTEAEEEMQDDEDGVDV